MTKRIAFITHSRYPVEPRARRMAEACAERGYAVDVFGLLGTAEDARQAVVNGVNVHRMPLARRQGRNSLGYAAEYVQSFLMATRRIVQYHRKRPYALIQVYNPPDILVFSSLIPRLFSGTRVVFDVRDMAPELFRSRFGLGRNHFVTRMLLAHERSACRYAHKVTVCTQHQRQVMAARGIPAEKMLIVMNTPDDKIFGPPPPLPRPPAAADKPFTLVYHGSALERYGLGVLIQALPLLLADIPGLRVQCYGDGDFLPAAQALAQRLELTDIIHFNRLVPLETIPALIGAADLGIVPTKRDVFTDTIMATRIMEYAHMGVPAVVSRTIATTDYFTDDMVAYFEPNAPDDLARQILQLYHDPARAHQLAANARRFTHAYNWSHDKTIYLAMIEHLIGAAQ